MLIVTVLTYSIFTGLTFFSQDRWSFTIFRCLTGVGIGGVFGLAVALIAERFPLAPNSIAGLVAGAFHARQHHGRVR